ncbi:MAG: carboxypeptidase-like regulatory domain-containing protein [Terriglobia bacterium]
MQKTEHLRRVSWALAAFVLLFCTTARGQIITSTILGHVSDSSGAVVPGADVAITNQGTSITSKTVTDSVGFYSVSGLAAGVYTVLVTQKGFETSQVTDLQLLSAQTQRADVTLKVGAAVQVVTVTGKDVSMVHTDSVSVGTNFNNQQLAELPLYNDTIDAVDKIVPGFMYGQILSNARVNGGAYIGSLNYTLNGAEANELATGGQAYANNGYAIVYPQPESFQEFRVDSMNTNAEYTRTTTIAMVTKAGSNQFHGDLNEINANAALNANAFTNNALHIPRPGYVRNQMGINIGGPIKRDRVFFFLNYSEYIDRTYTPENLIQPSLAMHQGNFGSICTSIAGASFNGSGVCSSTAGQLYNPLTSAAFAGNVIPTSMFASQSNTLMGYLPAPSIVTPGLPNGAFDYIPVNRTAHDIGTTNDRFDFKLRDKDLLYATYMRSNATVYQIAAASPQSYGQIIYPAENISFSVAENHTFGPTALNEFRYAWFNARVIEYGQNLNFNPQTLFPGLNPGINRGLPTMAITGYSGMFSDIGNLPRNNVPDVEITDNFTKVHGRHTFKFGGDEMSAKIYAHATPGTLGNFSFNGQWTAGKGWSKAGVTPSGGNAFADFLLGDPSSDTLAPPGAFGRGMYDRMWSFYGQDTWQATSHLTVYYGLRYEIQKPWWYQINGGVGLSTYYDPATNQIALPENSGTVFFPPIDASPTQFAAYNTPTACNNGTPSCFTTTQALGMGLKWMQPDTNNFAPRFGFAYRPFNNNNTVIRAAYGVYYDHVAGFEGVYDNGLNTPWLSGTNGPGLTYASALTGNPPATGYQPDLPFSNPFPATLGANAAAAAHPTIYYTDRKLLNPVVQQWNLTLEHQFASQWMGRITYFGDQAHHIAWYAGDINIPNTMQSGVALQTQLPAQPWAAIDSFRSGGKSNTDELQIEMIKRFSSGLSIQSYYNYERSLDNVDGNSVTSTPPNWHNPGAEYGNTQFVRRSTFNIAYLYQLPVGQGKHFLPNAKGWLNGLVGGWEWSGDTTYGTGVPFSVTFQVPNTKLGWFGQNTTPSVANRADVIPGNPIYQGQNRSSHDVLNGVPWFNQNAFAPPAPYTWGDSSRNAYFGPGWANWDMALLKNFRIPGREGLVLQLRVEGLNAFNHFNLGSPGTFTGSGPYTQIADTRDGGPANPTQGLITTCSPNCPSNLSPYGQGDRYFQVGAKLFF